MFTTAKQQTIQVHISFFDALVTELINKSQIDSIKFFVIMAFHSNNITFLKQCSHCKRISYKELMCWNKYLYKKKEFKTARKKKNEKSDEFSDKFDDNFTLNSTFNSTFKLFSNTKPSASILNFMSVTD